MNAEPNLMNPMNLMNLMNQRPLPYPPPPALTRTPAGHCAQKIKRTPSWMLRGSLAWLGATVPNAVEVTSVFGAPNHGVLNRLNASNRACSCRLAGSRKVLNNEKSISVGRLVRTVSRRVGRVRSVNGAWMLQATGSSALAQFCRAPLRVCVQVLNHRAIVGLSIEGSPTSTAPAVLPTGKPDCAVTMPLI